MQEMTDEELIEIRKRTVIAQIHTLGEWSRTALGVAEVWNSILENAPRIAIRVADVLVPEHDPHKMENFGESVKDGLITASTLRRALRDIDLDDATLYEYQRP